MTDSRDRLPVDEFSEPRWQRIRQDVFAELAHEPDLAEAAVGPAHSPRRKIAVWMLAAAAVVAALVAVGWFPSSSAPVSTTSRLVATNALTRTTIGDVTVEVSLGTELVVTSVAAEQHSVVLENGQATFSVPKRNGRPPFRVQAADVLVEVVGTKFSVARASQAVRVSVSEGSVRVTSGSEQVLVHERGEWSSVDATSAEPPALPRAPGVAPKAPVPMTDPPAAAASERKDPSTAHVASPVAAKRAPGSEPKPADGRSRYEAASRLEPSDPAAAVALYLEVAREGGPWAANALYAAGRLELERGRREAARDLLKEYLSRFPRGANGREAKLLLQRIP